MIVSALLAVLTASAVQTPQQEYDAYAAQFQDARAICGTMLYIGNREANIHLVFRVAAGGKHHVYMSDRDRHFDLA